MGHHDLSGLRIRAGTRLVGGQSHPRPIERAHGSLQAATGLCKEGVDPNVFEEAQSTETDPGQGRSRDAFRQLRRNADNPFETVTTSTRIGFILVGKKLGDFNEVLCVCFY